MTFKQSFLFAFKTKDSLIKLAKGGFFSILFVTIFFAFVVVGYLMQVLCNSLEGRDARLPEWKNITTLFNQGVIPVIIILFYGFPFVLVSIVEHLVFLLYGEIPVLFLAFLGSRLLFLLVFLILTPVALIYFAVTQNMKNSFNLKQMIKFLALNYKHYFSAWFLAILLNILSLLGLLAVGIGFFFTNFAAATSAIHLFAQAYRISTPFDDDKDGKLRSSMTIPPPLH